MKTSKVYEPRHTQTRLNHGGLGSGRTSSVVSSDVLDTIGEQRSENSHQKSDPTVELPRSHGVHLRRLREEPLSTYASYARRGAPSLQCTMDMVQICSAKNRFGPEM